MAPLRLRYAVWTALNAVLTASSGALALACETSVLTAPDRSFALHQCAENVVEVFQCLREAVVIRGFENAVLAAGGRANQREAQGGDHHQRSSLHEHIPL
jgi:hypothetical protein